MSQTHTSMVETLGIKILTFGNAASEVFSRAKMLSSSLLIGWGASISSCKSTARPCLMASAYMGKRIFQISLKILSRIICWSGSQDSSRARIQFHLPGEDSQAPSQNRAVTCANSNCDHMGLMEVRHVAYNVEGQGLTC